MPVLPRPVSSIARTLHTRAAADGGACYQNAFFPIANWLMAMNTRLGGRPGSELLTRCLILERRGIGLTLFPVARLIPSHPGHLFRGEGEPCAALRQVATFSHSQRRMIPACLKPPHEGASL